MKNILIFDLADDLIARLALFLEENYVKKGRDLSRVAVVFGGQRPRLFLHKELSLRFRDAFFPPKYFSIDEFVEYVVSKNKPFAGISDLEACFTIYRLAEKIAPSVLKGRESFSRFLPWAREVLGFIEQLDLEDVKISSLKDIQLHARIGYDVPASINTLMTHIIALREAFHQDLKGRNTCSRGLMYLAAAAAARDLNLDEFDQILFCGFFYLHKTEESLLRSFYEKGKAALFFQGRRDDWSALQNVLKDSARPPDAGGAAVPGPEVFLHSSFDLHSQVGMVREILKTVSETEKTVIVLPDPASLIPLLSEISTLIKDFNVSLGYPLSRSSLYSLFTSLFRSQETRKEGLYYARDYLKVLSHPLVKNLNLFKDASVTRILVHKVEEVILGVEKTSLGGTLFIRLEDVLEEERVYLASCEMLRHLDISVSAGDLKGILSELHRSLFRAWEDITSFYDLADSLERFCDLLDEKSFLDMYPLNLKAMETIYACAQEFRDSSFCREPFGGEDIFKIFKDRLDTALISFSGSPLKGLQILGMLETRSLTFENVFVLDVNETVLPRLKVYEPLIPRDVMMSLGINRLEKEEEIQRYQFRRLIAGARNVHLFYQEREDKEKSRFVEELVWERQKEACSLDAVAVPRASFALKVDVREAEVAKSGRHIEFLKGRRYSASSVNAYLRCPLRFYYQYVLGLQEKEDLLDEPEASDVGTFIHGLLEETFRAFVGKRPKINAAFKRYFADIFERKFEEEFKGKMKSDAFLIKEVFEHRLQKFLEREEARDVRRLVCVEKEFEGLIPCGIQDFRFKAKIDRIDELDGSGLLILDYKTGSILEMPAKTVLAKGVELSRPAIKRAVRSFQLPVYLYLAAQAYPGVRLNAALYNLRDVEKDRALKMFYEDDETQERKKRMLENCLEGLSYILREILDPAVPFKADPEDLYHCSTCPFFYLCR